MTLMRITFIVTHDLDSPAGFGRYVPIAKELIHLGHEVNILTLHPDYFSCKKKFFIFEGINVAYVGQMHVRKSGNQKTYFRPLKLLWVSTVATVKLLFAALKLHSDIIHVGKPHPMNGLAGVVAARLQRKPLLFVDCDDFEPGINQYDSKWQKTIVTFFEKWVIQRADYLTTNTYFTRNRIVQMGRLEELIFYLPNGTDLQKFSDPDLSKLDDLRTTLDVEKKQVVSYIGAIDFGSHPLDLLLDAFKIVVQEAPRAKLLLVGGGKDFNLLEQEVEERDLLKSVVITGRVPYDEVNSYYQLSTLTTDPVQDNDVSRGRCPIKMMEAWASGTPFVSGNVGDRARLSGDPIAAVLCEPGSSQSLADAILKVLRDPQLRQQLASLGRQRAHEYDWSLLIQGLEGFYISALAKNN